VRVIHGGQGRPLYGLCLVCVWKFKEGHCNAGKRWLCTVCPEKKPKHVTESVHIACLHLTPLFAEWQVYKGQLNGEDAAVKMWALEHGMGDQSAVGIRISVDLNFDAHTPRPSGRRTTIAAFGRKDPSLHAHAFLHPLLHTRSICPHMPQPLHYWLQANFRAEVLLLRMCRDRNVVGFRGASVTSKRMLMVMEVRSFSCRVSQQLDHQCPAMFLSQAAGT
jgi:hypothetical protein